MGTRNQHHKHWLGELKPHPLPEGSVTLCSRGWGGGGVRLLLCGPEGWNWNGGEKLM